MANEKLCCTGRICVSLGVDAKLVPNGKCNHPNKRNVNGELLKKRIPIKNEEDWTHCIFCRGGECVFAGKCEHKEVYKDGK